MSIKLVTLGEFKRLIEANSNIAIGLQETGFGFVVIAQNRLNDSDFSVRHGRDKDKPRTWRLDRLALMLKSVGITEFRVRQRKEESEGQVQNG